MERQTRQPEDIPSSLSTNCSSFSSSRSESPLSNTFKNVSVLLPFAFGLAYPSGSNTNAMFFILPSVNFFFQFTPFSSKRLHAASISSTAIQI